jgi:hypothetical protein
MPRRKERQKEMAGPAKKSDEGKKERKKVGRSFSFQ